LIGLETPRNALFVDQYLASSQSLADAGVRATLARLKLRGFP
jgi:hypothetical protein